VLLPSIPQQRTRPLRTRVHLHGAQLLPIGASLRGDVLQNSPGVLQAGASRVAAAAAAWQTATRGAAAASRCERQQAASRRPTRAARLQVCYKNKCYTRLNQRTVCPAYRRICGRGSYASCCSRSDSCIKGQCVSPKNLCGSGANATYCAGVSGS